MTRLESILEQSATGSINLMEFIEALETEAPRALAMLEVYHAAFITLKNGHKFLVRATVEGVKAKYLKITNLQVTRE